MALAQVQRSFSRASSTAFLNVRFFSTPVAEKDIKKSVFISQSKDIYTNLALEEWLYRNFDFTNHHVLMLCRNDPSVVIGNKQNPWQETNISEQLHEKGIQLARRNTEGGAVYHDGGNLNMTFFTSNSNHNSKYNLEIISRALFREYGMKMDQSSQNLIIRNERQVTQTSSKVGDTNAYLHCNVMVNVNTLDLSHALQKQEVNIVSNVTQYEQPRMMNLNDANRKITVNGLLKAIGWEYMRTSALRLKDLGEGMANQQKGFQMINPTDNWFPGINTIRDNLKSWDWCYGETPKFSISRSFAVPEQFINNFDYFNEDLKITMQVEHGKIKDVTLFIPPGLSASGFTGEANVITGLKGQRFSEEALNSLEWSFGGLVGDKEKFVTDCVRQVMTSSV